MSKEEELLTAKQYEKLPEEEKEMVYKPGIYVSHRLWGLAIIISEGEKLDYKIRLRDGRIKEVYHIEIVPVDEVDLTTHPIQVSLLALKNQGYDFTNSTYREIGRAVGLSEPISPQQVKHHYGMLSKNGFLPKKVGRG